MSKVKSAIQKEWTEAKEATGEVSRFVRNGSRLVRQKGIKYFFKHYWKWIIGLAIIGLAAGLLSYYHDTIVEAVAPHRQAIIDYPVSWLFPILALIITNIPPLFGQEIVLLLAGLIWGMGYGSAIACVGTFLGEMLCFYLFKYFFTEHGKRAEHKNVQYECFAEMMRRSGVFMICFVRLSAVPSHLVTVMQSTIGISAWVYAFAVIVSLPKQLIVVYLGVLFFEAGQADETQTSGMTKETMISTIVIVVTIFVTGAMMYTIYMRSRIYYPEVMARRAKREQEAQAAATAGDESVEGLPPPSYVPSREATQVGDKVQYGPKLGADGGEQLESARLVDTSFAALQQHASPYARGNDAAFESADVVTEQLYQDTRPAFATRASDAQQAQIPYGASPYAVAAPRYGERPVYDYAQGEQAYAQFPRWSNDEERRQQRQRLQQQQRYSEQSARTSFGIAR